MTDLTTPTESDDTSSDPTAPPGAHIPARQLTLSGVLAVGVSFGFARYGYGLFLPDIRAEFGLSPTTIGAIGSATYLGYLAALLLVGSCASRVGPRALVVSGGLSATAGMTLVGAAENSITLVAGLILAGTSPGWIWAPYSDAAAAMLPPRRRERVLSAIPSGTAFGVAVAGPLALVFHGADWQRAWWIFAAGALLATTYSLRILPRGRINAALPEPSPGFRWLVQRRAIRLYLTAVSYGVIGSVYWLFAVESISSGSTGGESWAPVFWTLTGVAGCAALWTGAAFVRLGLAPSHKVLFSCLGVAAALLGVLPGSAVGAAVSAVLYGPCFMAGSALLAVWSYQVFPTRPTTGFSATVFFLGLGTITGPALAGLIAEYHGLGTTLVLTALLAFTTNATAPSRLPPWSPSPPQPTVAH